MTKDLRPVVKNLLFLTNLLSSVKIDKLVVPELVEVTSTDVILDCQYTAPDDNLTVQWLLNNVSVYEWSPQSEPKVYGVLHGLLDLTYRVSNKASEEHRALRIIHLTPELNGNYSCVVDSHGVTIYRTKPMLIYSFEREFDLTTKRNNNFIDVSCIVRGVYPRPDLTIEFNDGMVSGQWQRVWRSDSWLYDAMCHAQIKGQSVNNTAVVCRLNLKDADYTVIKKKIIFSNNFSVALNRVASRSNWKLSLSRTYYVILIVFVAIY